MKKEKLLIIIPARSGSTRVKHKNMKLLGGMPLLGHKIKSCINSKVGRVIVSTDSKKIAKYAKKLGADVPFLRPKKYSLSKASTTSCVLHAIRHYKNKKIKLPDYIAILPPTNPFLMSYSIAKAYKKLLLNKKFNSIISFTESSEHPFLIIKNNKKMFFDIIKFRGYKLSDFEATQDWPPIEIVSPAIKISKTKCFLHNIRNTSPLLKSWRSIPDIKSCIGYKITKREAFDINNVRDFDIASALIKN